MNEKVKEFGFVLADVGKRFVFTIGRFLKKVFCNKQAAVGFIVILMFIFMAVVGPIIFPYDPSTSYLDRYLPPSLAHFLGTDEMGRDLFRQLVAGTGNVLAIAFYTGILTVGVGTVLGILSGFLGGIVDKLIQGLANIVLTIPSFPVMLMLAALFTIETPLAFALVLSAWGWAGLCRAVRSQIMSIRERDFILICRVMKMGKFHVIVNELLPNIASYILINFIMSVRSAITGSVGIMMLGLAAYDPTNWGSMLERARNLGLINPKVIPLLLTPLVAIIIFQMGAILLANGLDEILNPRLRVN